MKHYKPTSEMRTSFLSKIEGGTTITIIRKGYNTDYDNIKNVSKYLDSVIAKDPTVIGWIIDGKIIMKDETR